MPGCMQKQDVQEVNKPSLPIERPSSSSVPSSKNINAILIVTLASSRLWLKDGQEPPRARKEQASRLLPLINGWLFSPPSMLMPSSMKSYSTILMSGLSATLRDGLTLAACGGLVVGSMSGGLALCDTVSSACSSSMPELSLATMYAY